MPTKLYARRWEKGVSGCGDFFLSAPEGSTGKKVRTSSCEKKTREILDTCKKYERGSRRVQGGRDDILHAREEEGGRRKRGDKERGEPGRSGFTSEPREARLAKKCKQLGRDKRGTRSWEECVEDDHVSACMQEGRTNLHVRRWITETAEVLGEARGSSSFTAARGAEGKKGANN